MKLNPLLLCDFYKCVHSEQYPKGLTKLTSYYTPRMSRTEDDFVIMFGLQWFIREYLQDYFNENFFNKPVYKVLEQYNRILNMSLGKKSYNSKKIEDLWELKYLPIEIKAIPEGTKVPIKVPMIEITNTHKDFAWVVNSIETLMSCSLWHTMVSANVGYSYRKIVDKYYKETVGKDYAAKSALMDFSMRGQESLESAIKSSAAFLLSFNKTATIPAIPWLQTYYNCCDDVGYGGISTEHSVMCSNFAVDGDEVSMIKRLLTEIYPNHSFSMVADSYDYWNLVENILPQLKKEILSHNGCLLIRGDSGDPVEIATKTVFSLWNNFGGVINSRGYRELHPQIKAVYGDSITQERAKQIYQILKDNRFAANTVLLGVGSLSMQSLHKDGQFCPYTRDTFGIATKTTYGEVKDRQILIYKNPKTDTESFKKSQKGLCRVFEKNGIITYTDGYTASTFPYSEENLLESVFINGNLIKEYTLKNVRDNLYGGEF